MESAQRPARYCSTEMLHAFAETRQGWETVCGLGEAEGRILFDELAVVLGESRRFLLRLPVLDEVRKYLLYLDESLELLLHSVS